MSMYVGVTGLKAATTDLNTTSHNIANASSTGFKNSRAEFSDMVAGQNGIGVQTQAINQLFQQGSVVQTGNDGGNNQLDLAIMGNGFFAVCNVDSAGASIKPPVYTRAGSFHVDAKGNIVNNLGQRLQDANGADIVVKANPNSAGLFANVVSINPDGTLTFNDATPGTTAKVGLFDFPNIQGLKAVGETEWAATGDSGAAVAVATPNIKGGYLEASNVDLTDQLVNMIIAQRNFQANSKTITTNQTLTETVTNMIR